MKCNDPENRITRDPAVLVGKPVVRGTRIPVSLILNYLENGYTVEAILSDFPNLSREDIDSAVQYAESRSREQIELAS